MIVKHEASQAKIDWDSPNNIPLAPSVFDYDLGRRPISFEAKNRLYVNDFALGADSAYALPVQTITDQALTAVFAKNMFRPVPENLASSIFYDYAFTLIALPYEKLDRNKYKGLLRTMPNDKTSNMFNWHLILIEKSVLFTAPHTVAA